MDNVEAPPPPPPPTTATTTTTTSRTATTRPSLLLQDGRVKPEDVICCKRKHQHIRLHPGNMYYYNLRDTRLAQWQNKQEQQEQQQQQQQLLRSSNNNNNNTNNNSRMMTMRRPTANEFNAMSDYILNDVLQRRQGRFLKLDDQNLYVVMGWDECKRKVNLALRRKFNQSRVLPTERNGMNKQQLVGSKRKGRPKKEDSSNKKEFRASVVDGLHDDDDDDDDEVELIVPSNWNKKHKQHHDHHTAVTLAPQTMSTPLRLPSSEHRSTRVHHGNGGCKPPTTTATTTMTTSCIGGSYIYGSPEDELVMRRWLNQHRLPQSVGDVLLSHGARNVEDVMMLIQSCPMELKTNLAFLDWWKLKRATHEPF